MHAQVLQTGLAHHKQESSRMVSSALTGCRRDDAQFLSGIKEACSSFRSEVSPLAALSQLYSSPFGPCCSSHTCRPFEICTQQWPAGEARSACHRQSRWERSCWSMTRRWHAGGALWTQRSAGARSCRQGMTCRQPLWRLRILSSAALWRRPSAWQRSPCSTAFRL